MILGAQVIQLVIKLLVYFYNQGIPSLSSCSKAHIMDCKIGEVVEVIQDRIFLCIKIPVLKFIQAELGQPAVLAVELLLLGLEGLGDEIVLYQRQNN